MSMTVLYTVVRRYFLTFKNDGDDRAWCVTPRPCPVPPHVIAGAQHRSPRAAAHCSVPPPTQMNRFARLGGGVGPPHDLSCTSGGGDRTPP